MKSNAKARGLVTGLVLLPMASGCAPASSSTAAIAQGELIDRIEVSQIVVRYTPGAPPSTNDGSPWGSQCVSQNYAADLERGPSIGAQMKVVMIDPPVLTVVAELIALDMQQCPYIEWAEADVVRFDVPSARDLDPAPTFSAVSER